MQGSTSPTEERRRIPPLLTGYWAFGQYWGIWVILVVRIQDARQLSYGEMGLLLALLSIVAMLVMTFVTPRMSRLPLGFLCAVSLCTLAVGSVGMALLPTALLWIAFAIVGSATGSWTSS